MHLGPVVPGQERDHQRSRGRIFRIGRKHGLVQREAPHKVTARLNDPTARRVGRDEESTGRTEIRQQCRHFRSDLASQDRIGLLINPLGPRRDHLLSHLLHALGGTRR